MRDMYLLPSTVYRPGVRVRSQISPGHLRQRTFAPQKPTISRPWGEQLPAGSELPPFCMEHTDLTPHRSSAHRSPMDKAIAATILGAKAYAWIHWVGVGEVGFPCRMLAAPPSGLAALQHCILGLPTRAGGPQGWRRSLSFPEGTAAQVQSCNPTQPPGPIGLTGAARELPRYHGKLAGQACRNTRARSADQSKLIICQTILACHDGPSFLSRRADIASLSASFHL